MARKTQASTNPQNEPSLSAEQALQLLRIQREKGQRLLDNQPITSAANRTWETVTRDVLTRAFGALSPNVNSVMSVGEWAFPYGDATESQWERQRAEDMKTRLEVIDGLIELLISNAELEQPGSKSDMLEPIASPPLSNRIFLVHGRNEAAIHETARFLEGFDLQVTILREQPNSGRTIIEKFIDFSDVAFAVVLLTGDDRGAQYDAPYEDQKPRARQNVILELGFFLGKLGRNKVCALYQDGVEIPSDYNGVLFIPLDNSGAWRLSLARELKASGLSIDMNKAV